MLGLRAACRRSLFRQFAFEAFSAEGLTASPAARVGNDFLIAMVDGNGTGIGFHRELLSHKAMWNAVAVAIEPQAEIFVDQRLCRVTVIVWDHWQRA